MKHILLGIAFTLALAGSAFADFTAGGKHYNSIWDYCWLNFGNCIVNAEEMAHKASEEASENLYNFGSTLDDLGDRIEYHLNPKTSGWDDFWGGCPDGHCTNEDELTIAETLLSTTLIATGMAFDIEFHEEIPDLNIPLEQGL